MKRRSSFESSNGSNNPIGFHEDVYNGGVDDGWCSMIGCGDIPVYERPDAITSAAPKHDASTADFFLQQTPDAISTGRRRGSKTCPGKSKDDNNKESGDHTNLSSLIASELSKLSLEDREKALEEIHGVNETNNEDPEEIKELLDQVKDELKRIRYKQAYEKAAFLSNAYVTDPELVIFFLRADNYDARKAAIRLVEHFKHKLKLFGEHTLVRDIMYDDLSEVAKSVLKSGFVVNLPTTDQSGRMVVACNMSELLRFGTLADTIRAMWYLSVRNTQMYPSTSKLGIVMTYFTHGMCNVFEKLSRKDFIDGTAFLGNSLLYKFAGVHFCFEHNTIASAIQTTLMMSLGKYARVRLRSHCGSRMECRYALRSYGIDIEGLEDEPNSLSNAAKKLIQRCQAFDTLCKQKQNGRLLPRPNDVLLGRGRPFQLYSGNLALTATIDRYRSEYTSSKKMHKKAITAQVVNNILLSGGCFLKKANNENGIDWEEVDFETARLKVSHSFRTMSKWHPENDDEGNENRGDGQRRGSEDESIESTPYITADEIFSTTLTVEPTSSCANGVNDTCFKKRRKGQNF